MVTCIGSSARASCVTTPFLRVATSFWFLDRFSRKDEALDELASAVEDCSVIGNRMRGTHKQEGNPIRFLRWITHFAPRHRADRHAARQRGQHRIAFKHFDFAASVFAAFVVLLSGCLRAADIAPVDPYRQAVLIGVWQYDQAPPLISMTPDLDLLEGELKAIGFDSVIKMSSPTQAGILDAMATAAAVAQQQSSTRAVLTLVYFGGHGTMVSNTSYLLAKDYSAAEDASEIIDHGGVRIDALATPFSSSGQPVLLVVDACRNAFTPTPSAAEGVANTGSPAVPACSRPCH